MFRKSGWDNLPSAFMLELEELLGPAEMEALQQLVSKHRLLAGRKFNSSKFMGTSVEMRLLFMSHTLNQLGDKLTAANKDVEAQTVFLLSVQLMPQQNPGRYRLASLYCRRREFASAKEHALAAHAMYLKWYECRTHGLLNPINFEHFKAVAVSLAHIIGKAELWLRLTDKAASIYDRAMDLPSTSEKEAAFRAAIDAISRSPSPASIQLYCDVFAAEFNSLGWILYRDLFEEDYTDDPQLLNEQARLIPAAEITPEFEVMLLAFASAASLSPRFLDAQFGVAHFGRINAAVFDSQEVWVETCNAAERSLRLLESHINGDDTVIVANRMLVNGAGVEALLRQALRAAEQTQTG